MDCGSSGFHDGDETSMRTHASVVRGEDSSAPMTNSWWRKLQLLPLLIHIFCKHRVERGNTVRDSPDSTCEIGTLLLFDAC